MAPGLRPIYSDTCFAPSSLANQCPWGATQQLGICYHIGNSYSSLPQLPPSIWAYVYKHQALPTAASLLFYECQRWGVQCSL